MNILRLTFVMMFLSLTSFGQTEYKKNDYVEYNTIEKSGNYIVKYTFKDYNNQLCTINYSLNIISTNEDIKVYGVPESIYDRYLLVDDVIAERKRIIKSGLFKDEGNIIGPDKNAMINFYAPYTKVIAEWIIEYLNDRHDDTRMNRIKMAMSFVQDIPYAIPPSETINKIVTGGIIPAPQLIVEGYGDCDSKAIFFVGIMCYLINPDDIRFAGEPGHTYSLIKNSRTDVVQGGTTTYFNLDGAIFLVSETAGPGRLQFGEKNNRGYNSATIEKIIFQQNNN